MKYDELQQVENPIEWGLYYDKNEVDAAIAELKSENERLKGESCKLTDGCLRLKQCRREKANLADELLATKRALWLARAYRGYDNSILLPSKFMRKVWDYVARKCRAKAEEYK